MRLLELIASLDTVALSRFAIEPGPGKCTVTATFAAHSRQPKLALYPGEQDLTQLRGPGQKADAVLHSWERAPDITGVIDCDGLHEQIGQLAESGLVGQLNVERLGRRIVVSTHAGTQAERDAWLRSITRGP